MLQEAPLEIELTNLAISLTLQCETEYRKNTSAATLWWYTPESVQKQALRLYAEAQCSSYGRLRVRRTPNGCPVGATIAQ